MPDAADTLPVYQIEYADSAQEEFEKSYLWRSEITSPEAAVQWADGLREAIDGLSTLPYRYETARDYPKRGVCYTAGEPVLTELFILLWNHRNQVM